jgi:geranylgeranyl diphosphate synthase type II
MEHIKEYFKKKKTLIDKYLDDLLPSVLDEPRTIHEAMAYAVKGGKRIRPILCLASAEACRSSAKRALKTACAIEMIHSYSLIHDDLPSMDNDEQRRGKPTCHKKFGTANAILTGDALLTLGFFTLANATKNASVNNSLLKDIAKAAGNCGMIAGQAIDISSKDKDLATLEYININKTGALIATSCKAGALVAGASKKQTRALLRYGELIGLVFQLTDDILDSDGYVRFMGKKRTYEYAKDLTKKAKESIEAFNTRPHILKDIADFILNRKR